MYCRKSNNSARKIKKAAFRSDGSSDREKLPVEDLNTQINPTPARLICRTISLAFPESDSYAPRASASFIGPPSLHHFIFICALGPVPEVPVIDSFADLPTRNFTTVFAPIWM